MAKASKSPTKRKPKPVARTAAKAPAKKTAAKTLATAPSSSDLATLMKRQHLRRLIGR